MKGTRYAKLQLFADTNVCIKAMISQNSFENSIKNIASNCVLVFTKVSSV